MIQETLYSIYKVPGQDGHQRSPVVGAFNQSSGYAEILMKSTRVQFPQRHQSTCDHVTAPSTGWRKTLPQPTHWPLQSCAVPNKWHPSAPYKVPFWFKNMLAKKSCIILILNLQYYLFRRKLCVILYAYIMQMMTQCFLHHV